jgi:hypothetical protein
LPLGLIAKPNNRYDGEECTVTNTADDRVIGALDDLSQTLEDNASDERLLAGRIRDISAARQQGASWTEAMARESTPGVVQLVSQVLGRMSGSSGHMRTALAQALRAEGASIASIAELFGVTHQRVSHLIRRDRSLNGFARAENGSKCVREPAVERDSSA